MKYILIIALSLSFLSLEALAGSPEIGDEINAKIARIKSVRSPSNQGKLDSHQRNGDGSDIGGLHLLVDAGAQLVELVGAEQRGCKTQEQQRAHHGITGRTMWEECSGS